MRLLSTMCLGLLIALAAFSTEVLAHAGPDQGMSLEYNLASITLDHMDYNVTVSKTKHPTVVNTFNYAMLTHVQPAGSSTRSHVQGVMPFQPPSTGFNRAHLLNGNRNLGVRLYTPLNRLANS